MWQTRMDMSRDECRKCLRCLELDAYGNMVSVLRAQGPFTEDKKRLLEELAKVLHISNERHRAEVRRAANDEKLSIIAEQLNGQDTWTDWAIEGRRTIPLLPRLKAHTAFTGLANSLSLVIATANEIKVPFEEKRTESIVKAETESHNDLVQPDKPPQKPQLPQPKTRGRKRKKSSPDSSQDLRNQKRCTSDMNNDDGIISMIINDSSSEVRTLLPSPLPLNSVEIVKNNETSISSDTPEVLQHLDNSSETPRKCTVHHENKIHNNEKTTKSIIRKLEINRMPDTAITKTHYEVNYETDKNPERLSPEKIIHKNEDTSNASNMQRRKSTNCETINSVISSCLEGIEEISEDNSESSGPGPPEGEGETIEFDNSKIETLNNQSEIEKDIELNPRLGSKNNIIMVQKRMKLSRPEKDVLSKVIVDDNLRMSSKSMIILPNCSLPNNNEKAVNLNSKIVDEDVLDNRQDELELNNHNEDSFEPVDDINSKSNSTDSIGEQNEDCGDNNDNDNVVEMHVNPEDIMQVIVDRQEDVITEVNEQSCSNDISHENCVEETIEITEETIGGEILIQQDNETVLIDAQTEIYNFDSTDDNVCEIQIEETVPTSTLDLFTTPLTSEEITLENYTYEEMNQLDS